MVSTSFSVRREFQSLRSNQKCFFFEPRQFEKTEENSTCLGKTSMFVLTIANPHTGLTFFSQNVPSILDVERLGNQALQSQGLPVYPRDVWVGIKNGSEKRFSHIVIKPVQDLVLTSYNPQTVPLTPMQLSFPGFTPSTPMILPQSVPMTPMFVPQTPSPQTPYYLRTPLYSVPPTPFIPSTPKLTLNVPMTPQLFSTSGTPVILLKNVVPEVDERIFIPSFRKVDKFEYKPDPLRDASDQIVTMFEAYFQTVKSYTKCKGLPQDVLKSFENMIATCERRFLELEKQDAPCDSRGAPYLYAAYICATRCQPIISQIERLNGVLSIRTTILHTLFEEWSNRKKIKVGQNYRSNFGRIFRQPEGSNIYILVNIQ
jgi:hypothetical protein